MTYIPEDVETMNCRPYQSFDTQLFRDEEPFRNHFNELLKKFKPDSYEIGIGAVNYGRYIVAKVRNISNKIENIIWFQSNSYPINRPLDLEIINKIQKNLDLGKSEEFNKPKES
jgi:hypothetical protein